MTKKPTKAELAHELDLADERKAEFMRRLTRTEAALEQAQAKLAQTDALLAALTVENVKLVEDLIAAKVKAGPQRRNLPDERTGYTHKFSIANHEGYITANAYPDGTPGELFVTMSKSGSVVAGLTDSFAVAISLALQYGVPLSALCRKFKGVRFEPSGYTTNPQIQIAKSIMDYVFRWLELKFLGGPAGDEGVEPAPEHPSQAGSLLEHGDLGPIERPSIVPGQDTGEVCAVCGGPLKTAGKCKVCMVCGTSGGCG